MSNEHKFGLLRNMLRAIGLSQQAADDVVNFILDLLWGEGKTGTNEAQSPEFPYQLRDHFLSPAELSFFEVLRTVVGNQATLCTKVGLSDLFRVKNDDASAYRRYTNKIDRKHVDFLLCDSSTMRPILGIELDDKSHQRADRRERDAFVDQVFQAAGLPLVHIPVKRTYGIAELSAQLAPFLGQATVSQPTPLPTPTAKTVTVTAPVLETQTPTCPKCGKGMLLRTTKSGANAGSQFWGCSNYPTCRAMLPYTT
ncbi:MAG: DUF2726 domain-containing protein [Anaerolineae bacterium]|jgi:hypothetical protein|nr:DUF2726 domain-containing protein [Anaerolineae bacterium]